MAGSYPDAPSRRMAFDDDGSIGFRQVVSTGLVSTVWSATQMGYWNEETTRGWLAHSYGDGNNYRYIFFFPEGREVDGFFARCSSNNVIGAVDTSTNTTNGVDGTWTNQIANYDDSVGNRVNPYWRDQITSMAVSGARALRWADQSWDYNIYVTHIYGEITPGQTPDRLLFVDNGTSLEYGLPIDYGDVPRGSAADTLIKLRNNSSTLTANTVQMTGESLYLNSGAWYTFSDGGSFQATLPLASSISSSSDSPTITIRRVIPDAESIGLHAGRIQVGVGSWT